MLSYTWECSERSNKSIPRRKRFWCDQYEYKNTAKTTLNGHVEQNMRKESINLITESIKLHFRVLSRWNKSIHTGVMFGCDKCEYKFTEKTTLIRHIRRPVGSGSKLVLVTSHYCVKLLLWYENDPIY